MSAISDDEIVVGGTAPRPQPAEPSHDPKPRYKSWRKKFRKMKVQFDECIKFNSHVFKEEQKLEALARRLRESNDQLLDILLDLNSSLSLPPEDRFNVNYRDNWADREKVDIAGANRILAEAYDLDQKGRYSHAQFSEIKSSLESHLAAEKAKPLAVLEAEAPQPAYKLDDPDFQQSLNELANPIAYLTHENEEEYLRRLDTELGEPPLLPNHDKEQSTPTPFNSLSARDMERESELRNPQSVHNWLKRHNVSTAESDDKSEQGASNKKGASRNLAKKVGDRSVELAMDRSQESPIANIASVRHESENGDDDDAPNKRRRSRDADETYRPKGGKSGKPKRKREDGGEVKGTSKKPKTSISGMSDA